MVYTSDVPNILRRAEPDGKRVRPGMLNRFDRRPPAQGEAMIEYLDGDFRVLRPGAFVRCAVTGEAIPVEDLRYWSVDLQEAYASREAVLKRLAALRDEERR